MTKHFENAKQLAQYFMFNNTDTRQWGQVSSFSDSAIYRKYNGEMKDKYFRGKPVYSWKNYPEFMDFEEKTLNAFIDFLEETLEFPLYYECICDEEWSGPYFTYYNVNFIPDNQLSLFY